MQSAYLPSADLRRLIEAALDQPRPSKKLVRALNQALTQLKHPVAPEAKERAA